MAQNVFVVREAYSDIAILVVSAPNIQTVVDEFYPGATIDASREGFTTVQGGSFYCDYHHVVEL